MADEVTTLEVQPNPNLQPAGQPEEAAQPQPANGNSVDKTNTGDKPKTDVNGRVQALENLKNQGLVEVENGDGSKSQYTIVEAQNKMKELEDFKVKLGGNA